MKYGIFGLPKFVNEGEEADWWASRQDREFVKRKPAEPMKKGAAPKALLRMLVHEGLWSEARRS